MSAQTPGESHMSKYISYYASRADQGQDYEGLTAFPFFLLRCLPFLLHGQNSHTRKAKMSKLAKSVGLSIKTAWFWMETGSTSYSFRLISSQPGRPGSQFNSPQAIAQFSHRIKNAHLPLTTGMVSLGRDKWHRVNSQYTLDGVVLLALAS